MKKFLSMVMAAAMVVSLVPATAFAASDDVKATARVVDAENYTQDEIEDTNNKVISGPELQLRFTATDYSSAAAEAEITLTLDNAFFTENGLDADTVYEADRSEIPANLVSITAGNYSFPVNADGWFQNTRAAGSDYVDHNNSLIGVDGQALRLKQIEVDGDDELILTIEGKFDRGWMMYVDLETEMDKTSKGKEATVSVSSSDITISNDGADLVYASVESEGIDVSIKDTTDIAEEEIAELEEITVEPSVGSDFAAVVDTNNDKAELTLRLSSGYEFTKATDVEINGQNVDFDRDDDEITIMVDDLEGAGLINGVDEWKITGLEVEATSAKAGSTGTIRVTLTGSDTVSVEAINVVDYAVQMSVDEDEDVPVIYSGVNVDNDGITDDSDHESLEVTLEETFAGAWSDSKDFTISVPEGVYITDVDANWVGDGDLKITPDAGRDKVTTWFADAYYEGEYLELAFERRTWEETEPGTGDKIEVNFTLTLVADPNFEGDVVLKLTGDAMEEQEVTVAKFVKPFTVKAEQNDMKIDYRNTEIPTSVVITEAEAGLWDKNAEFVLALDKIEFDDEGTLTIDDQSGLEVKDDEIKENNGVLSFTVDSRSDDEPASVTISGMQLYMERSLPAGAYDLDVWMDNGYQAQELFAKDKDNKGTDLNVEEVEDVNDDFYSTTAKAGFVNIVTAGRDQDDSSFTTKVVVPVGEKYLIAGEQQVSLDVPAYISAAGYTMLPIRAVSYALGITTDSVLWDQASRTVTVMYGSRIISMQNGQSVMYVNGSAIPMSGAVEIVDGRAFIPMRDLGVALGVSDIVWDASTRTATLNGSK
ncbi:MAG TPA: copper amine oxidase N-terminal domain-containing protein [Candidatus Anaerotignum merdipullorum]|nr:copper amine oxidase N-terminal domain-containing protein [Candidatus Anaerotignum merdipullorum]